MAQTYHIRSHFVVFILPVYLIWRKHAYGSVTMTVQRSNHRISSRLYYLSQLQQAVGICSGKNQSQQTDVLAISNYIVMVFPQLMTSEKLTFLAIYCTQSSKNLRTRTKF